MANQDRANGFQYHSSMNAGGGMAPPMQHLPLATTNEPLGLGDLVSLTAAGTVDRTCTDGGGDHQENSGVGVFQGIRYMNAAGELVEGSYCPGAQGDDTNVLTAGSGGIVSFLPLTPQTIWSVQCDDGGAVAISQTLVGNAQDPLAVEATDPTQLGPSGRSNMELDMDLPGAASTGPSMFHIVGLDEKPGRVFGTTEADSRFGRVLVVVADALWGITPTATGI